MSRSSSDLTRRRFLDIAGLAGFGTLASSTDVFAQYRYLAPTSVANPLSAYPNRDWEALYRDIYRTDRSFSFLCCPNDTHNCLLNAFVKNDVVVRIEPTYGYGNATDLSGNQATHRWDPRCCQKGLVLARRFYGDRRVKGAFVRSGFKEWVDKGFPRDPATGAAPKELMRRGWDSYVKVSHTEAYRYHAKALQNVAKTYSGEQGSKYLLAQGYNPDMVKAATGAGTRVMKFRGGMALQGAGRIFGAVRFANSMALLDANVRGVKPADAKGAGVWDSYSFHTDLPPGHPMVHGEQTNDFELFDAENAKLILVWGMNWTTTKMPDSHWLTESRLKGAKVVNITVDYSATSNKADDVVVIRPATDTAFALGVAREMINKKLYNEAFLRAYTDLPTLVRMDTLQRVKASDVLPNHTDSKLENWTSVLKDGQAAPPTPLQTGIIVPQALVGEFADVLVWDTKAKAPVALAHDQVGAHFDKTGVQPALEGTFKIQTVKGETIEVRPVFDLIRQYLNDNMTPAQCNRITWAPPQTFERLARAIAASGDKTLFVCGMGPNQFWNNDLKDRAIFLVAALAGSIGRHGGNVGSFAGNYKNTLFSGMPRYTAEDPFNLQLNGDPAAPIKVNLLVRPESMHYWANGERLMEAGNKKITLGPHVPTPTKTIWQVNSNSSLGNQKYFYDVVFNTLPKCEVVAYNEWWWTASCEFADVVYGVDSWMEFKQPDFTASNSNPFLQVYPRTPIRRSFETVHDNDTYLGVARELTALTGDPRFTDAWRFIADGQPEVYLQRILDGSAPLKGYRFADLEENAKRGIPALLNTRTYPRVSSFEQVQESKPWFTKTGRLEFYRPETEFIEAGENLIVHREASDATFYDPCSILAAPHPAIRPKKPADWGLGEDRDHTTRQMRNTTYDVKGLLASKHPLRDQGWNRVVHTPKYRHAAHTMPVDTDFMAVLFGPFGDMYRRDKRMPFVGEMYVDLNPADAKEIGVEDGDYVWVDGDPAELPFRGWQTPGREAEYKVARLMVRVRYFNGTPPKIARIWFNGFMATPGTVKAAETRPDGLAKNAATNYQALFRYGGHQSLTRSWLKPTQQTQSLITRKSWSFLLNKGFNVDVHCVASAPREAIGKFAKAEDGGYDGQRLWRPVTLGLRPTYESEAVKRYLAGGFVRAKAV